MHAGGYFVSTEEHDAVVDGLQVMASLAVSSVMQDGDNLTTACEGVAGVLARLAQQSKKTLRT
jgi:hypothetical protein